MGLHELLGHGSGKLLKSLGGGEFNFDKDTLEDPTTNKKVSMYFVRKSLSFTSYMICMSARLSYFKDIKKSKCQ